MKNVKNSKRTAKSTPNHKEAKDMLLILFDRKTQAFLSVIGALFLLLVLFKINGSSIALWNNNGPADKDINKKNGLLFGNPKAIRIDEWARNTPFVFSQYLLDFPKSNPSMGAGNNALPANMPVKDITTIFRPLYWGFFLFDLESGYSWYWNFRLAALVVGFFLMFMLLTRNNFLLSVFGSFWVLTSSATQWWTSSYLPEILAYSSLAFVSVVYFIFSDNLRIVTLNVFLFVMFAFSFIAVLYPPWQVLCGYLLGLVLLGYLLSNPVMKILRANDIWKRAGIVFSGLVVLGALLLHFYIDLREYVSIMLQTVYPGSRVFAGGEMTLARLFSGFLFSSLTETNVPPSWYNICEASGYILFFPFVLVVIFFSAYKGRKISLILWMLCGYLLLMSVWIIVGLPSFLAKISLLSNVSEVRTAAFVGVASIILVIVFLNEAKEIMATHPASFKYLLMGVIVVFVYFILGKINGELVEKMNPSKLLGFVVYFVVLHFFLFSNWKWSSALFFVSLMPLLLPNLLVNPVSAGLAPIMKHPVYGFVNEARDKYSDGRWVVFGQNSSMVSNLLKASGVRVFGGTIVAPDIKELEILDSAKKFNQVYNRYSQCSVVPMYDKQDPEFVLPFADATELHINPCSKRLNKIGVKYALFLYQPAPQEVQCMKYIENPNHFPVFAYIDNDSLR